MSISSRRRSPILRLVSRCVLVLSTGTVLAACGNSGSADHRSDVASLTSGAPVDAGTTPNANSDAGRPQLRLDSSDEDSKRLWTAYKVCLKDHGATDVDTGTGAGIAAPDGSAVGSSNKAAVNACAKKLPLGPPELDPAKNPNFTHLETQTHVLKDGRVLEGASGHSEYPQQSKLPDGTPSTVTAPPRITVYNVAAVVAGLAGSNAVTER